MKETATYQEIVSKSHYILAAYMCVIIRAGKPNGLHERGDIKDQRDVLRVGHGVQVELDIPNRVCAIYTS